MKVITSCITICFILIIITLSNIQAKEVQVIAGAGPSTVIVQLFVDTFKNQPEASGYTFQVPPKSAKHAGGIKGSDTYIFGRTGRPLNEKEKAMGKKDIFLGRVPVAFAVGNKVTVKSIKLEQLEAIINGTITNWNEVSGSDGTITIIGREPKEALFSLLKSDYPFFNNAKFDYIVKKDNHVVDLLGTPQGEHAIGFGSHTNFANASVKTIQVDGLNAGVSLGLVYDIKNENHELVIAVKHFLKTKEWRDAVGSIGLTAPKYFRGEWFW